MDDAELWITVLHALDRARPDAFLSVLRPLLAERIGATQVRLLLANCEPAAVRPVQDPEDRLVLGDTPAGEAFLTQRPVTVMAETGTTTVCLPVSVRGDRMGVLVLLVPEVVSVEAWPRLGQLATIIGYALASAARQSDVMQRAARSKRSTLAVELQQQLLPGRGARAPEFQLAGHLESANCVHGDNFDWSQDGEQLVLGVSDGACGTRGQLASLLTTLAVTALRNARRGGLGVADQVWLADQAVYAHHQGSQYLSTLMVGIDLGTGHVSAVRAGSPRLLILRGGQVLEPPLTDQLPIGMFEGTDYVAEHFTLVRQDRLLLVSDGIHGATSPKHERFGQDRLPHLLTATADLSVGAVIGRVIDELHAHRSFAALDDDAAVICLDWFGNGRARQVDVPPRSAAAPTCGVATALGRLRLVPGGQGGHRVPLSASSENYQSQ